MNKEVLIQLTKELYRLTLLFPKKEPLRYKMREIADDILADLLSINNLTRKGNVTFKMGQKLEILDGFFEVAKSQNWVSSNEILNLQEEYSKVGEEVKRILEKPLEVAQVRPVQVPSKLESYRGPASVNERQEKILAFLRENGRAQVWQAKQILPEVTKRTLRRDFENLLKQGKIERIGERNDTSYQIKAS